MHSRNIYMGLKKNYITVYRKYITVKKKVARKIVFLYSFYSAYPDWSVNN